MGRYTNRLMVRVLGLALVVVVAVGCGGPSAGQGPDASAPTASAPTAAGGRQLETTKVSVRFVWVPQFQFAGYIVAKVKGFYDEVGLDVTLNPGGPEIAAIPLVSSGSDNFGVETPDSVMLARERGIPLVALATFFQASPGGFMVHSDSGIAGPQDFAGKIVAISPGSLETEYRGMLAANQIDRSRISEVPFDFNLEPFLSRRVDVWPVYVTDQPNTARKQGADVRVIVARDFGVTILGDGLFTTEAFLASNPNTTQAFVDATLKGWEYAVANPDETVALLAAYNKELTADQLAFEAGETIKLLRHGAGAKCIGWNDRAVWEAEQKTLVDLKILKAPIDLDSAINNRFVANSFQKRGIACQ